MSWLYVQTWLCYLIAFTVGLLLAWAFLVLPEQRRLRTLQAITGPSRHSSPYPSTATLPETAGSSPSIPPPAAPEPAEPEPGRIGSPGGAALYEPIPAVEPRTDEFPPIDSDGDRTRTAELPAVPPDGEGSPAGPSGGTDPATSEFPVVPAAAETDTTADATAAAETPVDPAQTDPGQTDAGDTTAVDAAAVETTAVETTAVDTGNGRPKAAKASAGKPNTGKPSPGKTDSRPTSRPRPHPAGRAMATAVAGSDQPVPGPWRGSARPLADGSAPNADYTIKGDEDSMLFHTVDSPHYQQTRAEVWFQRHEDAEAAGFTSWTRRR